MKIVRDDIPDKVKRHLLILKFIRKYKLLTYVPIAILTISAYGLRMKNEKLVQRVVRLETVNQALVSNMVLYNRNFETFPMPIFQKLKRGDKFIAQYFNPAYVLLQGHNFGYDRYRFIGKTDYDYYPKEVADVYHNYDVSVAFTGIPMKMDINILDSLGMKKSVEVMKWRHIREKDTLVYGMIILEKPM